MIEPNKFHLEEQHEMITKLDAPELENHKSVAFIHLGKYHEALKFTQKNSFESAYAYYKLKEYKKALRIANKNTGEKWEVLKSQILYCMGFFNKSFELLSKLPKDDEIVINLQAMRSMGILTEKVNKQVFHKLYIKKKEDEIMYDTLDNYKFSDQEAYAEYLYNKTFECADKKSEFNEALKKLDEQFPKTSIFKTQLFNVEGYFDEIDVEELLKTKKNVLNYNMKKTDSIENGLHYLSNYQSKLSDNQYKWIAHAKKNNFKINWNELPNTSETLIVLRILVGLINKNINVENIKKNLADIKNETIRKKIEEYLNFNITKDKEE